MSASAIVWLATLGVRDCEIERLVGTSRQWVSAARKKRHVPRGTGAAPGWNSRGSGARVGCLDLRLAAAPHLTHRSLLYTVEASLTRMVGLAGRGERQKSR